MCKTYVNPCGFVDFEWELMLNGFDFDEDDLRKILQRADFFLDNADRIFQ